MTPNEHIEEMGMTISMMGAELLATKKELKGALAALEEAQQQLASADVIIKGHEISAERKQQFIVEQAKYGNEIGIQLREAQQTIALQRETLEFYASYYNHDVQMEDTGKTKIQIDGGDIARSRLGFICEFKNGKKVKIVDGFAHIGETAKVVSCSRSGRIISYKLDTVSGWWPQSSLEGVNDNGA